LRQTRVAHARLLAMLAGAAVHKTTKFFRNALDFDYLNSICTGFAGAEKALEQDRTGERDFGEELREVTVLSQAFVDDVLGDVGDLYEFGAPGRSLYFPVGPGVHPLSKQVKAALDGLEADAKLADPVLPTADIDSLLDLSGAKKLYARLLPLEAQAAKDGASVEQALKQRNAFGDAIRAKCKAAERFVRRLHKNTPEKLAAYGLHPQPRQLLPKPGAAGKVKK